jgi:hypothetical protein
MFCNLARQLFHSGGVRSAGAWESNIRRIYAERIHEVKQFYLLFDRWFTN